MAESSGLKQWRKRQRRGAIMKPETFKRIEKEAKKRGLSARNAKKEAGRAYWNAAEAKYRKSTKTRGMP